MYVQPWLLQNEKTSGRSKRTIRPNPKYDQLPGFGTTIGHTNIFDIFLSPPVPVERDKSETKADHKECDEMDTTVTTDESETAVPVLVGLLSKLV